MTRNRSDKGQTIGYFLIQSFFWGQYAILLGYTSMYLLDHSYSNGAIGMAIAASGLVSALLQPMVATYADRPDSWSVKKLLICLTAIVLAVGAGLLLTDRWMICVGLLYSCGMALLQLMTPLINSLGIETINQGKQLNFGFARAGGSFCYAVTSYIIGALAERFGTIVVPIGMLVVFIGLLIALLAFPFEKTVIEKQDGKERESIQTTGRKQNGTSREKSFFARYPRFTLVLIGCILIYVSHAIVNNFAFQIVSSKGGGSAETGTGMAIGAMTELLPMFAFSYMLKKLRVDIWLRISGIFFTLKILSALLAPNIPVYYGTQVFQMLGWGVIAVASVYYVNAVVEPEDTIKGQAYMTMTFTLGTVLGASIGGTLMDLGGVNLMLLFGIGAAAAGMIIILLSAEKTEI